MLGAVAALCGCVGFSANVVLAQDYGDTPYVQTPQNVVDKMLEIAKVGPKDFVIDLGSGDGRMIITAAKKHGARGFGVDLDQRLVKLSNANAAKAGVADRAVFYARDLHETDLTKADVLTIYLLPEVNLTVRPRLLDLKPGTRVVSHDYDFGDWPPEMSLVMDAPGKSVGRDMKSKVFFWTVPARIAGKWVWQASIDGATQEFDLQINQRFQKISGTMSSGGRRVNIDNAELIGDRVKFTATQERNGAPVRFEFDGKVINNAIAGDMRVLRDRAGTQTAWSATRVELRDVDFTESVARPMAR